MSLREDIKKYISHTAFLPMSQFNDSDSISALRPKSQFSWISITAMLVDATFNKDAPVDFPEEDISRLDSVNDFVAYLEAMGITKVNPPPKGYN